MAKLKVIDTPEYPAGGAATAAEETEIMGSGLAAVVSVTVKAGVAPKAIDNGTIGATSDTNAPVPENENTSNPPAHGRGTGGGKGHGGGGHEMHKTAAARPASKHPLLEQEAWQGFWGQGLGL